MGSKSVFCRITIGGDIGANQTTSDWICSNNQGIAQSIEMGKDRFVAGHGDANRVDGTAGVARPVGEGETLGGSSGKLDGGTAGVFAPGTVGSRIGADRAGAGRIDVGGE